MKKTLLATAAALCLTAFTIMPTVAFAAPPNSVAATSSSERKYTIDDLRLVQTYVYVEIINRLIDNENYHRSVDIKLYCGLARAATSTLNDINRSNVTLMSPDTVLKIKDSLDRLTYHQVCRVAQ